MSASDPPPAAAPSWRYAVGARVATLWPIKMAANLGGPALFFAAYFWVLHHPRSTVTVMPLTAFDRWIAFQPAAMPLYLSLWLYVSLPLALLRSPRELASYGVATFALSAAGLAIFVAWPTAVPHFPIDWSQHASVAFLKAVDAGGNACPSLHVAFALFSAVWLARQLRETGARAPLQLVSWAWCAGIVYSTVATRQHVVLDVAGGAALGLGVAALHLWALRRLDPATRRPLPRIADAVRGAG